MLILLLIIGWSLALPVPQEYPLKKGKPTSKGIEQYVEEQSEAIKSEFQKFIGDTLHNVWIYAEDLSDYLSNDSLELGWYYPNEIFITTAEKFLAYELDDLSPRQQALHAGNNKFVKSALIHELTHNYLHQIILEMRSIDSIPVYKSYHANLWILNAQEAYGRAFIEEGLCEYLTEQMGEILPPKRVSSPRTMEDLMDRTNRYDIKYKYSAACLKPFLDTMDFKQSVKILFYNPPPSYAEILEPHLYFDRLRLPDVD
jgi:hypothetical protein